MMLSAASLLFVCVLSASPVLVFDTAFLTGLPTDTLPAFSGPLTFTAAGGGGEVSIGNAFMLVGEIDTPFPPQATLPSDPNIGFTPITLTVEYFVDGSVTPTPVTFHGSLEQDGYVGVPGNYIPHDYFGFDDTIYGGTDTVPFPGYGLLAETSFVDFFGPVTFDVGFEPAPVAGPEPRLIAPLLACMLSYLIVLRKRRVATRKALASNQ
jgi:hypothetical protein